MLSLLWLVPALPVVGFIMLVFLGPYLNHSGIRTIGVGSVALSTVTALLVGYTFLTTPSSQIIFYQRLWQWISIAGYSVNVSLYLDHLSLLMMLVITFVAFLILFYSAAFMEDDKGYARFFAYMNLFVAMMLLLVLADNFLLLYLGWEGVGLCSYLLIGFWYHDTNNGNAARKAFIVTRIGDTAMVIGLLLIFLQLGTFDIQTVLTQAGIHWPVNSSIVVAVTLLLLGGAVGKSAQLPLQTWLPDAMAGPTPVSALIHAATMVTAGVYLIARTHTLFALAPPVQTLVAIIGLLTLLLAGFSALTQIDIKRVLAYSTMSQIGYMFLALGVGAWPAAMFHFMTHAFFKALLFLSAGAVILNLRHEHDIFKMGGLRKHMPLTFLAFIVGTAALAALPLISAGYYSKDVILFYAWKSPEGGLWLWLGGITGALLTSLYAFRLVFIVFFNQTKTIPIKGDPGAFMLLPMMALTVLSVAGGFIPLPWAALHTGGSDLELGLKITASAVSLFGVYLAYLIYLRRTRFVDALSVFPATKSLALWWRNGWGFDAVYDLLLVRPYSWLARINRNDIVDSMYDAVAWLNVVSHKALSQTQTGHVRLYAAGVLSGGIILLGISLWL